MALYCAIDLHSTNNVPVVIDENDKILFQKRLPNDLAGVHAALATSQAGLCVRRQLPLAPTLRRLDYTKR